jgi:hypothetical protein
VSAFSAPFSRGTRSEGFCFQSGRLLYGREPKWGKGGIGKAEDANLPDAGISLKQCRENEGAEKGWPTSISRSSRPKAYLSVILLISPIGISGHSHFPDTTIR